MRGDFFFQLLFYLCVVAVSAPLLDQLLMVPLQILQSLLNIFQSFSAIVPLRFLIGILIVVAVVISVQYVIFQTRGVFG